MLSGLRSARGGVIGIEMGVRVGVRVRVEREEVRVEGEKRRRRLERGVVKEPIGV